jgi:hypothetical protein
LDERENDREFVGFVGAKHLGDNLCGVTKIFMSKCFALSQATKINVGAKHLGDNLCGITKIFISKCFALS